MTELDRELPFLMYGQAAFYEGEDVISKAGAKAKKRHVAGIMSTEEEDQQGETILQEGIDYDYFLTKGYFNDHHDKTIAGLIGYPERVIVIKKGEKCPDGTKAPVTLSWVEGQLLENDARADAIWEKGLALRGTPRSLGFSVEGKSRIRSIDGKTVIKSFVRHCAITHMPVNAGATAQVFLKSLALMEHGSPEAIERGWIAFEKAFSEGANTGGDVPASLEKERHTIITKARGVDIVRTRYPGISEKDARRVVEVICRGRQP